VCAWFKGQRSTTSYRALVSWEPVIVAGGRPLPVTVVQDLRDGLIATGRHRAFPGAMIGMKPPAFSEWVFRLLGALPGDELTDLYPGSGAVTSAWERYVSTACRGDGSPEYSADASLGDEVDASLGDEVDASLSTRSTRLSATRSTRRWTPAVDASVDASPLQAVTRPSSRSRGSGPAR
jgi:hypothetical protein